MPMHELIGAMTDAERERRRKADEIRFWMTGHGPETFNPFVAPAKEERSPGVPSSRSGQDLLDPEGRNWSQLFNAFGRGVQKLRTPEGREQFHKDSLAGTLADDVVSGVTLPKEAWTGEAPMWEHTPESGYTGRTSGRAAERAFELEIAATLGAMTVMPSKVSRRLMEQPTRLTRVKDRLHANDPRAAAAAAAPKFFSQAERTATMAPQTKATPEQWLGILLKRGVKQAELDYIGLPRWLDEQKAAGKIVTQADLVEFIKGNKAIIKSKVLGGAEPLGKVVEEDGMFKVVSDKAYHRAGRGRVGDYEIISPAYATREEAEEAARMMGNRQAGTSVKYPDENLSMPGGKNYREELLKLERAKPTYPQQAELDEIHRRIGDMHTPGKELDDAQYRALIARQRDLLKEKQALESADLQRRSTERPYQPPHFEGEENLLMHMRYKDRTTLAGRRTLTSDEWQSDWAAQGMKEGYAKPHWTLMHKDRPLDPGNKKFDSEGDAEWFLANVIPGQRQGDWTIMRSEGQGVPDMPFKSVQKWLTVGMKQMIMEAVEKGYDSISWTTGKTQNERYNLEKHLDELRWDPERGTLHAKQKHSARGVAGEWIQKTASTPEELAEFVGKEMAEKLLNAPLKNSAGRDLHTLKGLDLKVGGEGKRKIYDQAAVQIANKLGKKYNTKVEVAQVPGPDPKGIWVSGDDVMDRTMPHLSRSERDAYWAGLTEDARDELLSNFRQEKAQPIEVWELPITDAMRKAVSDEGFATFANRGRAAAGVTGAKARGKYMESGPPGLYSDVNKKLIRGPVENWRDVKTTKKIDYFGKMNTADEEALRLDIQAANKDINAGNYEPYFDVSARFSVDPSKYPARASTREETLLTPAGKPKNPELIAKWRGIAGIPEKRERLIRAYNAGKNDPGAKDWYFMGQLEREFINEYGPEQGRALFQERFADAMAATTGGMTPAGNLRGAAYGNYQRQAGQSVVPEASHQIPGSVGGGKYGMFGNLKQYEKLVPGNISPQTNPKRYDFSGNFTGDVQPVLDEQMAAILKHQTPEGITKEGKVRPAKDKRAFQAQEYAVHQELMEDVAKELGIDARRLQEVAWSGHKLMTDKGYERAKPMIEIVNEAVERTSRVTGVSPAEVVRLGLVRSEMPIYSNSPRAAALFGFIEIAENGTKKEATKKPPLRGTYGLMSRSAAGAYPQYGSFRGGFQPNGRFSEGAGSLTDRGR